MQNANRSEEVGYFDNPLSTTSPKALSVVFNYENIGNLDDIYTIIIGVHNFGSCEKEKEKDSQRNLHSITRINNVISWNIPEVSNSCCNIKCCIEFNNKMFRRRSYSIVRLRLEPSWCIGIFRLRIYQERLPSLSSSLRIMPQHRQNQFSHLGWCDSQ